MSEFIKVKSLPIISVAHNFNSEKYNNFLPKTSNYLEIGYLKFGKMTYESCGTVTTLKENEIYVLSRKADISCTSNTLSEHHCFGMICQNEIESGNPIILKDSPKCLEIRLLIDKLILAYNVDSEHMQKIYALIFRIVDELNEEFSSIHSDKELTGEIMYINKIKLYVGRNISQDIHLPQLAEKLHVSVPYMCNIFKKITGKTIITYINKQKICLLKNIIMNMNLSLKEACLQVGISDPTYGSRLFKKIERQSIRDYKLSHRNTITSE
ncbi:MAG: AraC family transcriptional regulator [Candidatus Borkfalkiaceae bacterium]|nr:AraC family transcriptional regulator [Christensenellaceae bacterium]